MGRSPCCEKVGLKKGPWTPEEDQKLLTYIDQHGHGSWRALPAKAGLQRCGKSCRLRWTNYLRPDIKRGKFSLQEEQTIIQLHALLGNRWSAIATHLPKRTDNEIKNYWNTHLKKRLTKMGIDPMTHKPKHEGSGSGHTKDSANISHMAQWESARLEAEARLVRESKLMVGGPVQRHHLMTTATTSSNLPHASKAPPALPCLDVLKAWQGAWSTKHTIRNITMTSGGCSMVSPMDDLESPTSTLDFPKINAFINNPIQTVHHYGTFNENSGVILHDNILNNDVTYGCTDGGASATTAAWFMDPTLTRSAIVDDDDEEKVIMPEEFSNIVMEGFVDVMGYNSEDQQKYEVAGEIGGGNGGGDGSCGGGNLEENRSYWNSILNLVNASPSGSPVF